MLIQISEKGKLQKNVQLQQEKKVFYLLKRIIFNNKKNKHNLVQKINKWIRIIKCKNQTNRLKLYKLSKIIMMLHPVIQI